MTPRLSCVLLLLGACAADVDPVDDVDSTDTRTAELHTTMRGPRELTGSLGGGWPVRVIPDETNLYILMQRTTETFGRIIRVPKSGGTPTTVYSTGARIVMDMQLADGRLYWAGSTIGSVGTDGSSPTDHASGFANALAVDATTIYFINGTGTEIRSLPRTGGTHVLRATGSDIRDLVTDGTYVYWIDGQSVYRMARTGGAPTLLGSAFYQDLESIYERGDRLWILTGGEGPDFNTNGVLYMSKAGGDINILRGTTAPGVWTDLALTDTHVYWTIPENGDVQRHGISGSGSGLTQALTHEYRANALATDGSYLYWVQTSRVPDSPYPLERNIVKRMPLGDVRGSICTTTPNTISETGAVHGMSEEGTWMYFAERDAGAIRRVWRNGSSTVETVATGLDEPTLVVADAQAVYWAEGSGTSWRVRMMHERNMPNRHITDVAQGSADSGELRDFVVTPYGLYTVTSTGQVTRWPRYDIDSNEEVAVAVATLSGAERLAYHTDWDRGWVWVAHRSPTGLPRVSRIDARTPSAATTAFTFAGGGIPGDLDADNAHVYLTVLDDGGNRIVKWAKQTGTQTSILSGTSWIPHDIKAAGSYIYFTNQSSSGTALVRKPKSGASSTVLSTRSGTRWELDTDSSCVTYSIERADGTGQLVKVAR